MWSNHTTFPIFAVPRMPPNLKQSYHFPNFCSTPGATKSEAIIPLSQFLQHPTQIWSNHTTFPIFAAPRVPPNLKQSYHFPNFCNTPGATKSEAIISQFLQHPGCHQKWLQRALFQNSWFQGTLRKKLNWGRKSENGFSIDEIQVLCPIGLFSTNGKQKQIIYIKRYFAFKNWTVRPSEQCNRLCMDFKGSCAWPVDLKGPGRYRFRRPPCKLGGLFQPTFWLWLTSSLLVPPCAEQGIGTLARLRKTQQATSTSRGNCICAQWEQVSCSLYAFTSVSQISMSRLYILFWLLAELRISLSRSEFGSKSPHLRLF